MGIETFNPQIDVTVFKNIGMGSAGPGTYSEAVIISFDPWLVSGRNDLISEFIKELLAAIKSEPRTKKKLKAFTRTFAKYGDQLAPLGNYVLPGSGIALKTAVGLAKMGSRQNASLAALRSELLFELSQIKLPIVVLIDELDRIEDREIRTVAQLVRSVVDFSGISYVLAYDRERVVQALGEGPVESVRMERGRSYLEKIVQIQIPLPIALDEEIVRMLTIELEALQKELGLPAGFSSLSRFRDLITVLVPTVIQTPRDIKRLLGSFRILAAMLSVEVDWIDLLAYNAMLIKAPGVVGKIRNDPDLFAEDALSVVAFQAQSERSRIPLDKRLDALIPAGENNSGVRRLIGFVFPSYSEKPDRLIEHSDALCLRRPLFTTLRLGLLPGAYSRAAVEELVRQSPEEIEQHLRESYDNNAMAPLIDRLDDLYVRLRDINHVQFWKGVARFVRKPDCEWMTSYQPMHEVIRNFAAVLQRAVSRDKFLKPAAAAVFSNLMNGDEDVLTASWLRGHIFMHGLYGQQKRPDDASFLDANQTEANARRMSIALRPKHLSGGLIPCRWNLQPVYTMLDMSLWDAPVESS